MLTSYTKRKFKRNKGLASAVLIAGIVRMSKTFLSLVAVPNKTDFCTLVIIVIIIGKRQIREVLILFLAGLSLCYGLEQPPSHFGLNCQR